MNTDHPKPFAKRRNAVLRRPFLLTLLFFLLLFGSYFAILLTAPGSPYGNGDGAAGSGSGPAAGDGSGSGAAGSGHGGFHASGTEGTGSGNAGKRKSMGTGKAGPAASPAPVRPGAPSSGKTENALPEQSASKNPLRYASPLAAPQEKFAALSRSETADDRHTAELAGSEGKEGVSGGTGGSGAVSSKGFYGLKVHGNTIFLLDVSGSMGTRSLEGSRIDLLKLQLKKAIRSTSEGRYGIITFSTGAKSFPEDGKFRSFRSGYDKEVRGFVDALSACGGTDLMAGLLELKKMLNSEIRIKTVFLLTDGEPSSPWSEIMDFIQKEIPENITFNTISIGQECPEMKQLAKKRGGRYRCVR